MSDDGRGVSAEEWRDLVEVGKALVGLTDLDEVLELIMDKAQASIRADNWSLLLMDQDTGRLRFGVVHGIDPDSVKGVELAPGEGIAGQAARSGEPLFVGDVKKHPAFCGKVDKITGFKTTSIVCFPLKFRGRVLGVIELVNLADYDDFVSTRWPILQGLADYAAIALENARTMEELQRQSVTDSLTGLYNDRFLATLLSDELERSKRSGVPYSIVFLDLDNFKQIVDTYGHMAGSETLRQFARFLAEDLGPRFPSIRFGGDEFVVPLPGFTKEQAKDIIEGFRKRLAKVRFEPERGVEVTITASFGISSYPGDGSDLKTLLQRSDDAMYRIKRAAKNGVGL